MTPPPAPEGRQRIDKWLWHARFVKTRTLAQRLAESGHVRVNRERVTAASQVVKTGDVLTIALNDMVRVVKVVAFAERRGGSPEALLLYEDLAPVVKTPATPEQKSQPTAGPRPDKHERRIAKDFKERGGSEDEE